MSRRVCDTSARRRRPGFATAHSDGLLFQRAVDGLRTGEADRDQDGIISVDDAYRYAADRVLSRGGRQNPQRWLDGGEGDIPLAYNQGPARVRRPAAHRDSPAASTAPRRRPTTAAVSRRAVAVVAGAVVAVVLISVASAQLGRWPNFGTPAPSIRPTGTTAANPSAPSPARIDGDSTDC